MVLSVPGEEDVLETHLIVRTSRVLLGVHLRGLARKEAEEGVVGGRGTVRLEDWDRAETGCRRQRCSARGQGQGYRVGAEAKDACDDPRHQFDIHTGVIWIDICPDCAHGDERFFIAAECSTVLRVELIEGREDLAVIVVDAQIGLTVIIVR